MADDITPTDDQAGTTDEGAQTPTDGGAGDTPTTDGGQSAPETVSREEYDALSAQLQDALAFMSEQKEKAEEERLAKLSEVDRERELREQAQRQLDELKASTELERRQAWARAATLEAGGDADLLIAFKNDAIAKATTEAEVKAIVTAALQEKPGLVVKKPAGPGNQQATPQTPTKTVGTDDASSWLDRALRGGIGRKGGDAGAFERGE